MSVTFTNGRIALTKDLIFGVCAYGEYDDGSREWIPVSDMTLEQLEITLRAIDNNPTCPVEWLQIIRELRTKRRDERSTSIPVLQYGYPADSVKSPTVDPRDMNRSFLGALDYSVTLEAAKAYLAARQHDAGQLFQMLAQSRGQFAHGWQYIEHPGGSVCLRRNGVNVQSFETCTQAQAYILARFW